MSGTRKLLGEGRMRPAQCGRAGTLHRGAVGSLLPPGCPGGMELVSLVVALPTGAGSCVLCGDFSDSPGASDVCR